MIDFRKYMGYYDLRYPALDPTTPHYEFNSYVECCESLGVTPSLQRFMSYRRYLKSVGIL
jgi:alkyl sulfatase BDS1-like metallo-beta-lactamase superfamily hydrolase